MRTPKRVIVPLSNERWPILDEFPHRRDLAIVGLMLPTAYSLRFSLLPGRNLLFPTSQCACGQGNKLRWLPPSLRPSTGIIPQWERPPTAVGFVLRPKGRSR